MKKQQAAKVLVVEDEAIVALDIKAEIESLGHQVCGLADNADRALSIAGAMRPDVALVDIHLKGDADGIALAKMLRHEQGVPVIYLTAYSDDETVQRAAQTSAYGYLTKPFQAKELKAAIAIAIHNADIERRLQASEQRFRNAFDHAPLGMAMVSPTGHYLEMNEAMCRLLGLADRQVDTIHHRELSVAEELPGEQERLNNLLTGRVTSVQFEKHYRCPGSDRTVPALVSVSLLPRNGGPLSYLYQALDLTSQKKSAEQQALLEAERTRALAAELATKAKNQFLSRMSHELRTPLNAVMGFAQLLKLRGMDTIPGAGPYVDHILRAGEHLVAMVEDVLDLQRAVSGKLALQMAPTALRDNVERAIELLSPMCAQQDLEQACEIPGDMLVLADPTRLRQVLLNIGSNAIKYNRRGGSVRWVASYAGGGRVRLQVQDSGCGIDARAMAKLFEPFERLGQERGVIPGTGLGLLIARSLMEDMGGSLDVQSTPGVGTTVSLEFAPAQTGPVE